MSEFEFRLAGLTQDRIDRSELRQHRSKSGQAASSRVTASQLSTVGLKVSTALLLKTGLVLIVIYAVTNPLPRIDPLIVKINSPEGATVDGKTISIKNVNRRVFEISGTIANPKITRVRLETNKLSLTAPVTEGKFLFKVPLVNGPNRMQVIAGNVASQMIDVTSGVPKADIWIELKWDGPEDIDLHLFLPDESGGRLECFFNNCIGTPVGGATLDIDQTLINGGYGPEHIEVPHATPGRYIATAVYFGANGTFPRTVHWEATVLLENKGIIHHFSGYLSDLTGAQTIWEFDVP